MQYYGRSSHDEGWVFSRNASQALKRAFRRARRSKARQAAKQDARQLLLESCNDFSALPFVDIHYLFAGGSHEVF